MKDHKSNFAVEAQPVFEIQRYISLEQNFAAPAKYTFLNP
jgi:hypothetical protein